MRDVLAQTAFDGLVGQEAQRPARVAFGRITTRKRSEFGALQTVNLGGPTRAWRVVQTAEASRVVGVTPSRDRWVADLKGSGNVDQRLAPVKFEQGGRAFELLGRERAVCEQLLKRRAIIRAQGEV